LRCLLGLARVPSLTLFELVFDEVLEILPGLGVRPYLVSSS